MPDAAIPNNQPGGTGKEKQKRQPAAAGGIYGLAFLGALVFYIQHAENFAQGLLGVLKALAWPALLVYKLLNFLN